MDRLDPQHEKDLRETVRRIVAEYTSRAKPTVDNPFEYYIGTTPDKGTPWNDSWPSVDWDDLAKVVDAVPTSPRGRYIVSIIGQLYPDDDVKGMAFVKSSRELHRLFTVYQEPGGELHGLPFLEQMVEYFDLVREPVKIIGWAVRSAQ